MSTVFYSSCHREMISISPAFKTGLSHVTVLVGVTLANMMQTEAWRVLLSALEFALSCCWENFHHHVNKSGQLSEGSDDVDRSLNHPRHLIWAQRHVNKAILEHPASARSSILPAHRTMSNDAYSFKSLRFGIVCYVPQKTINFEPGSLKMFYCSDAPSLSLTLLGGFVLNQLSN